MSATVPAWAATSPSPWRARGADLAIAARRQKSLDEWPRSCARSRRGVVCVPTDITRRKTARAWSTRRARRSAASTCWSQRLPRRRVPLFENADSTPGARRSGNVPATLRLTQAVVPVMNPRRRLDRDDQLAVIREVMPTMGATRRRRRADGATQTLRASSGHGIRVNSVVPGSSGARRCALFEHQAASAASTRVVYANRVDIALARSRLEESPARCFSRLGPVARRHRPVAGR